MLSFLLLLGFAGLAFWPSLLFPYLDIDELIWGEMANSIVDGCPPYVCVIGAKPPLLYLFYAGVFAFIGRNSYLATHTLQILWVATTAFLLLVSLVLAIFGLLLWPLRMAYRLITIKKPPKRPRIKRAVVIGLDGLDPKLTRRFMEEIAKLAGRPDFQPQLAGRRWKPSKR